jgi:4-hydroxybenzoate polyprenyltransferase
MRPIASGRVSWFQSLFLALFLLLISIFFLTKLSLKASSLIILYLLLTVLYSIGLKKVVLIDVFIIAIGFILRVLAGAYSIDVVISKWFFITTLFLSLFLAISKRRMELSFIIQDRNVDVGRGFVSGYTLKFSDQMLTVTSAGAVISYALYTISEGTVDMFGTEMLIYTTIFVLYGIFRYMYLIYGKGYGENPTDIILSDPPLLINIFLWLLFCILVIYKNQFLHILGR